MNTEKEYIEMCKQAKEIQELWKPQEGDWCLHHDDVELVCLGDEWQKPDLRPFCDFGDPADFDWYKKQIKEAFWLPRQDQLQEMIKPGLYANHPAWNVLFQFYDYMKVHRKGFDSFEQAWLIFVMKANYNKVWNGKEWNQN